MLSDSSESWFQTEGWMSQSWLDFRWAGWGEKNKKKSKTSLQDVAVVNDQQEEFESKITEDNGNV